MHSFRLLKINLAAAFWIIVEVLMELAAREQCNSQVWTEQEPDQELCCMFRKKGPDLIDLEKANLQDRCGLRKSADHQSQL